MPCVHGVLDWYVSVCFLVPGDWRSYDRDSVDETMYCQCCTVWIYPVSCKLHPLGVLAAFWC